MQMIPRRPRRKGERSSKREAYSTKKEELLIGRPRRGANRERSCQDENQEITRSQFKN